MVMSVQGSRELKAAVVAVKRADRDLRNDLNRATRATMSPVWEREVTRRARTPLEVAVYKRGARILGGNPPVAQAATSRRALEGGLVPADDWAPIEFGTNTGKRTTYQREKPSGGSTSVTRHTARQLNSRRSSGYVGYAALRELGPRLASLWVQLIVQKFSDAYDGKE